MTALQSAVSAAEGAELLVVGDPWAEVTDSLLGEAGYYHQSTEAISEVLRTTEVHPANVLPGDTVLIDRCINYDIIGSTYTYGNVSAAAADSTAGIAVVYTSASSDAAVSADTAQEPLPEAGLTEPATHMVLSSIGEDPSAVFAAIAQQHQLCWYFRPAAECSVQASLDPASAPYDITPRVTFSLNLTPSADSVVAKEDGDDLAAVGYHLMQVVVVAAVCQGFHAGFIDGQVGDTAPVQVAVVAVELGKIHGGRQLGLTQVQVKVLSPEDFFIGG